MTVRLNGSWVIVVTDEQNGDLILFSDWATERTSAWF